MKYARLDNPDYFDEVFQDAVGELVEETKSWIILRIRTSDGNLRELRLKQYMVREITPTEYFKQVLKQQ